MKWQTAAAPLASNPPVVRLLGYFEAGQTEKAAGLLQVGRAGSACGWLLAVGSASRATGRAQERQARGGSMLGDPCRRRAPLHPCAGRGA